MITIDGKSYNELELHNGLRIWKLLTDNEKKQVQYAKIKRYKKTRSSEQEERNCIDCQTTYSISKYIRQQTEKTYWGKVENRCNPCKQEYRKKKMVKAEEQSVRYWQIRRQAGPKTRPGSV